MTATEILHLIGEFLLIDIDEIEDIDYPKNQPFPQRLGIVMKNGRIFGLYIAELRKE